MNTMRVFVAVADDDDAGTLAGWFGCVCIYVAAPIHIFIHNAFVMHTRITLIHLLLQ